MGRRKALAIVAAIVLVTHSPVANAVIQPKRIPSSDGSYVLEIRPWDRRGSGTDLELTSAHGVLLARTTCDFAPRFAIVTSSGSFAVAGIEPRADDVGWRLDLFDRSGARLETHDFEDREITSFAVSDDETTFACTLREPGTIDRRGHVRRVVRFDAVCGEELGSTDIAASLGFRGDAAASLVALEPLRGTPCFLAMLRTEGGAIYGVLDIHGAFVGAIDALADGPPEPLLRTCPALPWDSRGAAISRIGFDRDFDLRFRSSRTTTTYQVGDGGPERRILVETGSRRSNEIESRIGSIVQGLDADIEEVSLVRVGFVPRTAKDEFAELSRRSMPSRTQVGDPRSFVAPDGTTWRREDDGSWTIHDSRGRRVGVADRRADGGFVDVVRAIGANDAGIVVTSTGFGTIDSFDLAGAPLQHANLGGFTFSLSVLGDLIVLGSVEAVLLVDAATLAVRRAEAPDYLGVGVDPVRGEIVIEHLDGLGRYRVPDR